MCDFVSSRVIQRHDSTKVCGTLPAKLHAQFCFEITAHSLPKAQAMGGTGVRLDQEGRDTGYSQKPADVDRGATEVGAVGLRWESAL